MDDQWGQTWSLELCAWTIAAQLDRAPRSADEARRAAWLLGAAQARQRRLGVTLAGLRPFAEGRTRARARIATVLTEATIGGAMAAGARGQAHALRVALGEPTPRRPTASTRDGLTDREREVAMLVAAGLTSAEIGAQLRIGRRTVDTHVRNLMAKLGMHRRAAIAAWAASRATQQPR
jgi:non-specific serine/threonine protein kinase